MAARDDELPGPTARHLAADRRPRLTGGAAAPLLAVQAVDGGLANTANPSVAPRRADRSLLVAMMAGEGFRVLPEEWWHFTLSGEPYPSTFFDVPIRPRA